MGIPWDAVIGWLGCGARLMSIGVGSWPLPDPPPTLPPADWPSLAWAGAVAVPPPPGGAGGPREPTCDAPFDRFCVEYDGGGLSADIKVNKGVITHDDGRGGRGLGFSLPCLSVYPHHISKTDAARVTKLHTQMFHDESRKPIYFGGQQGQR